MWGSSSTRWWNRYQLSPADNSRLARFLSLKCPFAAISAGSTTRNTFEAHFSLRIERKAEDDDLFDHAAIPSPHNFHTTERVAIVATLIFIEAGYRAPEA
ncbi:hypothetical protein JAAARDRAFT_73471 [Jaapia argillacea MUCL 33604]|uniref:Uncharacterized protein n=1 Tax=Jaapia argillacea MUCL 33604 TaxID=933084 RepID=A0A067PCU2_9AGAM|nr:hypothetical protein JAAARDRAFT_73471 [Jaapia argillacea MUCL 33604]